jgi:hypothetical protein
MLISIDLKTNKSYFNVKSDNLKKHLKNIQFIYFYRMRKFQNNTWYFF